MKFIEMSGRTLSDVMKPDEMNAEELAASGVGDETVVRINQQGDIEVRRRNGWDVIGGLLGDFEERIKRKTGLEWA
jgi:hypothetical protein